MVQARYSTLRRLRVTKSLFLLKKVNDMPTFRQLDLLTSSVVVVGVQRQRST